MNRTFVPTITKVSALALIAALGLVGASSGATLAGNQSGIHRATTTSSGATLPCQFGGSACDHIGFTEGWYEGNTVDFEYSHAAFCATPPPSGADSKCEAGRYAYVAPPSGPVVSNLYAVIPMGFRPPKSTLQCPEAGHCIDFPKTIDLTAMGGSANAVFPAHSNIIEDDESFQSTWWPLVLVGVKNLAAWNQLVTAKSADAMDACESAGDCTSEFQTNAYVFFQVLGPGMSPTGPA